MATKPIGIFLFLALILAACHPAANQATATPTPASIASRTPTLTPACASPDVSVSLAATATTLKVGDSVTVTITLANRGCGTLGLPEYALDIKTSPPQPILDPSKPEHVKHSAVAARQSDTAQFVLRALKPGQATINASVSYEFHEGYPGPAQWESTGSANPLSITVAFNTLQLIGYFYGLNHNNHVSDIPADKLTAILYAFADVSDSGECISADAAADRINFPSLQHLKQQNAQLKTLISVGGYTHSGKFSDAALTDDSRRRFAQSCVQLMKQNGFDGIDIDWETPVSGGMPGNVHRPEDKHDFTLLLADLRKQLDDQGQRDGQYYVLTIAAPAGPSEYANLELGTMGQYLDWINLETYAYYTAASPITNFNAPLYASSSDPTTHAKQRLADNANAAVRAYVSASVPPSKLLLGVPFYGRGWTGVPDVNHGLYQKDGGPATDAGLPKGTWKDGAMDYKDVEKYYVGSYPRFWHDEAQVPWLYNPATQIFISYDDPQSLGVKADYVRNNNLGGVMIWQLSADDAQHSLVNALYAHMRP